MGGEKVRIFVGALRTGTTMDEAAAMRCLLTTDGEKISGLLPVGAGAEGCSNGYNLLINNHLQ